MKVAIVETKPSRNDYQSYFGQHFEFDLYQLCSDPNIKKVYKKDCDINIDTDQYDWIILIGADALKYFTKESSVTVYSGKKIGDKYLASINPAMLTFKPEVKKLWDSTVASIIEYITGDVEDAGDLNKLVKGINTIDECHNTLKEALNHSDSLIAVDCETTALYPRDGYLQGISMYWGGPKDNLDRLASYTNKPKAVYISSDCFDETAVKLFQEIISKKTVIFQNAKFDISFIEFHLGVKFNKYEDIMLLHYIIDETPGTHGLKDLATRFTIFGNYEKPLQEWIENYRKTHGVLVADFIWDVIPFEVMVPYAAMDALVSYVLFHKFVKIKGNDKLRGVYENILIPATSFVVDMQNNGVPFSQQRLQDAQDLMQKDIDEAIAKLYKNPQIKKFEEDQGKEFNPNSVVQLRKLLFDYLGLQPTGIKTGTGADSTNKEVLKILSEQSEVPQLILDIRQKSKIKNTYLDKIILQLDSDGRLRTFFNLHTTTSGRLSSSGKLNMQQLPRDNPIVKGCIQAKDGYVIVAMDLGTAEVYVASVLSGDKALQNVFKSEGDFHSTIAKIAFNLPCKVEEVKEVYPAERQAAKAVTFGIMYGAGPHKIAEQITKDSGKYMSVQEAGKIIDDYFREFPDLKKWLEQNQAFVKANGYIYSCFGRKRRVPNVFSSDRGIVGHEVRSALNFLVQSASSDINLLGAIEAHQEIKVRDLDAKIFALVHDSILAEVHETCVDEYVELIKRCVQRDRGVSIPGCPVKCDIDIGDDYSMGKFEKEYVNNVQDG